MKIVDVIGLVVGVCMVAVSVYLQIKAIKDEREYNAKLETYLKQKNDLEMFLKSNGFNNNITKIDD